MFGGYDRAKVDGQGYTYDLSQDERCSTQLLAVIDDIILHFLNGTEASLVRSTDSSFEACIVRDFPDMVSMAYDPYMESFMGLTNTSISQRSLGLSYYTLLYDDGDSPYQRDMSILIRNRPSIRIPNSQLAMPERYIRDEDGQLMANYSKSNLVINSLQDVNADDLSQLGRQFLSSAYLLVNQDSRKFTLWSVNLTRNEDLVGIDQEGQDAVEWCTSVPNTEPSGTPGPTANKGKSHLPPVASQASRLGGWYL